MLRRALSQSMQQLKLANSDAGAMVDRRIVTKLLLTWVERGRSDQSVLNLMASMLGFTGAPSAPCQTCPAPSTLSSETCSTRCAIRVVPSTCNLCSLQHRESGTVKVVPCPCR